MLLMYQGFYGKGSYVVYLLFAHFFIPFSQPSRPRRALAIELAIMPIFFSSLFDDFAIVLCQLSKEWRALGWPAYVTSAFFSLFSCWFFDQDLHTEQTASCVRKRFPFSFFKFDPCSTHDRCLKTSVKSTESVQIQDSRPQFSEKHQATQHHFTARSF